jgi:hypothetical protein
MRNERELVDALTTDQAGQLETLLTSLLVSFSDT